MFRRSLAGSEAPRRTRDLALRGRFRDGIALHGRLRRRSPEDDFWAALCLAQLGDHATAIVLLRRSLGRGHLGAAGLLAASLRSTGQHEDAAEALGLLRTGNARHRTIVQGLDPFAATVARREWALERERAGELASALEWYDDAWASLSATPGLGVLRHYLALRTGLARYRAGYDSLAHARFHEVFELGDRGRHEGRGAGVNGLEDGEGTYFLVVADKGGGGLEWAEGRHAHVLAATHRGRREGAERALERLERDEPPASLGASRGVLVSHAQGAVARAAGDLEAAARLFGEAATGANEWSSLAALDASAVAVERGRFGEARAILEAAHPSLSTPWLAAMHDLRLGALLARERASSRRGTSPAEAERALARAAGEQSRLHRLREAAWASLHLAALHVDLKDSPGALGALEGAHALLHRTHDPQPLRVELRALPRLRALLEKLPVGHPTRQFLPPDASEDAPSRRSRAEGERSDDGPQRFRLVTLGDAYLEREGARLERRQRRAQTYEFLLLLLRDGPLPLHGIATALFPDLASGTRKATTNVQDYKADLQLEAGVGVVVYDKTAGTYGLAPGLEVAWDVAELRAQLARGPEGLSRALDLYRGDFLPLAETEWVEAERAAIKGELLAAGVEALSSMRRTGRPEEAITTAERLLGVEPHHEAVSGQLVRALREGRGETVAHEALVRMRRRVEEDLGGGDLFLRGLEDESAEPDGH